MNSTSLSEIHAGLHCSYWVAGNAALRRKEYEAAITFYQQAKAVTPDLAHLIESNIQLVRRRLGIPLCLGNAMNNEIDIIVPVFNALEDVKCCLESLEQHTDGFRVRVIVVNDGSDGKTTQWLRQYCQGKPLFALIEHLQNTGYTRAVNTGLKASTALYVITQNSDTIVTAGWLQGLVRCMESDPNLGIVGPLSNAATWQNVPVLRDESGSFAVNQLPEAMSVDDIAKMVAVVAERCYPRLPFVNGFCFMIRRAVIDAIGYMDEDNFPVGYGEENDYGIRAMDAGFELAIADDVYVFHAKSKSFGHKRRRELSKNGTERLKRKHSPEKYHDLVTQIKHAHVLDEIRDRIRRAIECSKINQPVKNITHMRVLFLLPVKGGGGGVHSVVQEVGEMRRLGLNAGIAVRHQHIAGYLSNYRDIENAAGLFVCFDDTTLFDLAKCYDIVVGTIFTSMLLVKQIKEALPHILPAYYVQDYEPMFFEEGTEQWKQARDSYTLVPNALLFAKTDWIVRKVKQEHGVTVHKVSPSIDHEVYKPRHRFENGQIHLAAMIRPKTPRRGAERTMRVLSKLSHVHQDRLSIHIFGCTEDDPAFQSLQRDFSFTNHGILTRPQVAHLLGQSDLFIDLSDYQAFGRTALEAMACGCASVVPLHGGADEYAIDLKNTIVVDTMNEDQCFKAINSVLQSPSTLKELQAKGLLTASKYSVHQAAISEILIMHKTLNL